MLADPARRHVVVLAPMPLEMHAIVTAFGLQASRDAPGASWTGRVGGSDVTAIHIGMGPPLTRAAVTRLLDPDQPDHRPVDHVMIAGICGGLDPAIAVGTLLDPEVLIDPVSDSTSSTRHPATRPWPGSS